MDISYAILTGDETSSNDGLQSNHRSEVDYSTLAKAEAAAHQQQQQQTDKQPSKMRVSAGDVGHLALTGEEQDTGQQASPQQVQAAGTGLLSSVPWSEARTTNLRQTEEVLVVCCRFMHQCTAPARANCVLAL